MADILDIANDIQELRKVKPRWKDFGQYISALKVPKRNFAGSVQWATAGDRTQSTSTTGTPVKVTTGSTTNTYSLTFVNEGANFVKAKGSCTLSKTTCKGILMIGAYNDTSTIKTTKSTKTNATGTTKITTSFTFTTLTSMTEPVVKAQLKLTAATGNTGYMKALNVTGTLNDVTTVYA